MDELNALLGLALLVDLPAGQADLVRTLQHDLFDVGADLAVPQTTASTRSRLRVTAEYATRLERAIDALNARLTPLTSFILPGGTPAASWLHLARTVCRRAERETVALSRRDAINPQTIVYLNRLSDLLFVMARVANHDGRDDVLWEPGKTQQRE